MLVALALFAAMAVLSMALCTATLARVLTQPRIEQLTNRVVVPALAVVAIWFGALYAGLLEPVAQRTWRAPRRI